MHVFVDHAIDLAIIPIAAENLLKIKRNAKELRNYFSPTRKDDRDGAFCISVSSRYKESSRLKSLPALSETAQNIMQKA